MKVIKLVYGQTLYDLAVQEYGHTDGIFLILEDNTGLVGDFADVPPVGTAILIRDVPQLSDTNVAIAAEIARRKKVVVSGMMSNIPFLLQENGGEILTEDGSGVITLDSINI